MYSIKEPVALNLQNTIYTFQHKEGKRVAYNPRNGYFICTSKVFLRGDTSKEFLYVMSETGQHIIALEQIYHDFENNNLKLNYLVSLENLKETYHTRLHLREVQVLPNGNIMVATGLASSHDFICIFDKDNFNLIKAAVAIDGAPLGITPTSILFYWNSSCKEDMLRLGQMVFIFTLHKVGRLLNMIMKEIKSGW